MRISADRESKDYDPISVNCEAYINGVKTDYIVMADEELGLAYQYVTNNKNRVVVDKNGNIKIRVLYGMVRIKPPSWFRGFV